MFTPKRRTENPRHKWSLIAEGTALGEDSLAIDTTDPRRNNRLHCVLETGITWSKLLETTSKRNFQGDRTQL